MRIVHARELDVNTAQTPGMNRAAAITARVGPWTRVHDCRRIETGRDADLLRYDPDRITTVAADFLAHRNQLSAHTGRVLYGAVTWPAVRAGTVFGGSTSSGVPAAF